LQLLLPNTAENERQELHSKCLMEEKEVFPNLVYYYFSHCLKDTGNLSYCLKIHL